ncbi:MAG: prolyl oligopeptidase family serine peptidase [Fimbriimonadaceae bacterium]|nr:prolyl oligopeptidase family serine peptidase [Fimbriimonadaceae bacterium]
METGFLDREHKGSNYQVHVPKGVKGPCPTILFLHGAGECGTDGLLQTAIGLPDAVRRDRTRWPFLVVCPQKDDVKALWADRKELLDGILRDVEGEFPVDPHRRYITGLSQGGHGTFDLAAHLGWRFAAAAAVCGRSLLDKVGEDFRHIPLWVFHGDADPVVKPENSIEAVEAVKKAGGDVRLTMYPGVDHNSWDKAYRESDLPQWFLSHTL